MAQQIKALWDGSRGKDALSQFADPRSPNEIKRNHGVIKFGDREGEERIRAACFEPRPDHVAVIGFDDQMLCLKARNPRIPMNIEARIVMLVQNAMRHTQI